MTKEYLTEILKEVIAEETTVDFDIIKSPIGHSVLAKIGDRIIGKLRIRNVAGRSEVENVMVVDGYRRMGIGINLYRLAHEELGPLYSDKHQTQDAKGVWQKLISNDEAQEIEIDGSPRFVMKEGPHDPMNPGILKKRLGSLSCTKVRTARGKLKDKGTTYAKALQRYLNYHCK